MSEFAWKTPASPSSPEWNTPPGPPAVDTAWPAGSPDADDTKPSNIELQRERVQREINERLAWAERALEAFESIQNIFIADAYAARDPLKMDRVRRIVLAVGEDPEGI